VSGGGDLDGERQAVQPPAERGARGEVGRGVRAGGGPVEEDRTAG
jgi:hypothetical protein